MTTPFEKYFEEKFHAALDNVPDERVFSNGFSIQGASWDRRAAYLVWCAEGRPGDTGPLEDEDLIG